MKTCKNCGFQLFDNAKFCPEYGAKLEDRKKFCQEFGNQLQPSAKFCPDCETPANAGDNENLKEINKNKIENKKETVEPPKKSKPLTGFLAIKEKGGVIVYDPGSCPSIVDEILTKIYPEYKGELRKVKKIINEAVEIFKSEETEWDNFGEPTKNVARFGYPDDDYYRGIYYHIYNNDTLFLKGEGNTFRILSEENQKKYDNFWILNSDIRKLQDKIKNLVVFGKETSIRARVFKDFKKLETVHFYGYVEGILREAFWNCPIKKSYPA